MIDDVQENFTSTPRILSRVFKFFAKEAMELKCHTLP